MRNCLCIILFLVLSLIIPATSVYAHSSGGGGEGGGGGDGTMSITGSTSSDATDPPSGFTPAAQENAGSEITTSSETDPGNEEEVAELVEEVNLLEDSAEEGELEGDSEDSAEEGEVEGDSEDSAEGGEVEGDSKDSAEEGEVEGDSNDSAEGTTSEDQGDKKTEVATLVDGIDPQGSADESKTTEQPDPDQDLIGSQGTLPGTKNATLDKILDPEINEDGSVSTWAIYSNDTWVETTVHPDGTHEVTISLDSGTIVRPGREYIHTGGSLNPALDAIITALEVTAAAGTVAGWALTVTPAGALASGGVKTATAVWGATTGVQALRAGADAYGQNIDAGASQGEAVWEGTKQTAVNATVVTAVGKYIGTPYEKILGSGLGKTGKTVTEVAVKNYGNFAADGTTRNITGYSPGYKPW